MKPSTPRTTVVTHECGWSSKPTTPGLAVHALRLHSCDRQDAANAARSRDAVRKAAVDREPKRCLHKRTTHVHGTHACYVLDRCHCGPCSAANAAYEGNRQRQAGYGRWHPYVDAQPTREHVERLRAAGMGLKTVAKVSGVAHGVLSKLIYGDPKRNLAPSKRVRYETAVRIQVVQPVLAGGARVDPTGARRRLQGLVAAGWSQSKLAERLGIIRANFQHTMFSNPELTARTVRAIEDLYDELWNVEPPRASHRDKIAYSRAVNYARAHGWAAPGAWLGIDIDDPAAHPNATGYDDERVTAVMDGALVDGDTDLDLALTRTDRLEILRRGQQTFKGHSVPQVAARLGIRPAAFHADLAAQRAGSRIVSPELDDIAVERFMNGTLRAPENARSPERIEAVRRLASRGLDDTVIGDRVGLTNHAVMKTRHRNGITSPLTTSREASA